MARALGGCLYREVEREVEIEAEIARDEVGVISSGRVLAFEPVESGDPVEAWDKWFEQSSGDWDDESVEASPTRSSMLNRRRPVSGFIT